METRSAKAAAHPHAPLDASFIPANLSVTDHQQAFSRIGSGVNRGYDTAVPGRKMSRKHQGAPKRPLVFPGIRGVDSLTSGLCPVDGPDEAAAFWFIDPAVRVVPAVLIFPPAPR